jgi:hypothetical protein
MQEEVNHCAAGVRWLRFLHAHATRQRSAAQQPGGALPSGARRQEQPGPRQGADELQEPRTVGAPLPEQGVALSAAPRETEHAAANGAEPGGCAPLPRPQGAPVPGPPHDAGTRGQQGHATGCSSPSSGPGGAAAQSVPCLEGSPPSDAGAAHAPSAGAAASCCEAGGQPPDWMLDAQRHATVEAWFHALVRAHFRGPLKASV